MRNKCYLGWIMRKFLVGLIVLSNGYVFAQNLTNGDFEELDEPYQYITGAYWGVSVGPTFVKHRLTASNDSDKNVSQDTSISKAQFDLGLMAGFGTSFHDDYYVGIEMEVAKRFGRGVHYKNKGDVFGLEFNPQFVLNMNVRFGYQLPKYGSMVYAMVGFSRTLGKVVGKNADGSNDIHEVFGSYYPIVGLGVEHKINYDWNVRLDVKYSITSSDSDQRLYEKSPWVYKIKPQSMGVRLSVTRNI